MSELIDDLSELTKVEDLPCERCQGNGEIVVDWHRYLEPQPGDVGDEAVADCPDCNGTGRRALVDGGEG